MTLESLRLEGGALVRLPAIELRQLPLSLGYSASVYARGNRLFELSEGAVTVIDTTDPAAPKRLVRDLPIWGCESLEVAADSAYCAAGERGVEVIDLAPVALKHASVRALAHAPPVLRSGRHAD